MNRSKKLATVVAAVLAAIMLLSLLLSLLVTTVGAAASSSEIAEQIEQMEKEYAEQKKKQAEIEANLAENNKEIQNMVSRKNGIDEQIQLLNAQVVTINQIISGYNLLIADKQEELEQAEKKLEQLQKAFRERIRAMEEQGGISYWSVIFKAASFSDLLDRLNMVTEIANSDRLRMEQIRQVAAQVEQTKVELDEQKAELALKKLELVEAQQQLEAKNNEAEAMLLDLLAAGGEYQKMLEEGDKLLEQWEEEMAKKEQEFDEAKYREWLATSVPPTTTAPKGHKTNTVDGITWYTPTKNYWVSSYFGWRKDPFTGKGDGHNGIDLAAPKNTPIYATRAGMVTTASYQKGGAGNYVWINHGDGFSTIYMHMEKYIVSVGQHVEAGEVIGYVGTTGRSTGYHLHFGVRYNREYVDPLDYIKV